ncbi:MAG: ribonuclease HII, partial [Clostridia bacterium]|nr:ribonuclease HII [Clostridia bacterium]
MDFTFEKSLIPSDATCVCGLDEAGRGPLAGPVFAGAVILPEGYIPEGLNDSKKL